MADYLWKHFLFLILACIDLYRYVVVLWLFATILRAFAHWNPEGLLKRFVGLLDRLVGPVLNLLDPFVPTVKGVDITPAVLVFLVFLAKAVFSWLIGYSL